jgi:hypothetical protein
LESASIDSLRGKMDHEQGPLNPLRKWTFYRCAWWKTENKVIGIAAKACPTRVGCKMV